MRILLMGAPITLGSGYGAVIRELASHLSTEHTVFVYCENYWGTLMKIGNYYITPSQFSVAGGYARPSAFRAMSTIQKYRPHLIIIIGDVLVLKWLAEWKIKHPYMPIISYFPVDGTPWRPLEVPIAREFDYRVCPSMYSKKEVEKYDMTCDYIPHGIDTRVFRPINKDDVRFIYKVPRDKFVYIYVGTNTSRKKLPRLFDAYSRVERKDTLLWLHSIRHDATGWNLPHLLRYFGIKNAVFTPFIDDLSATPEEMSFYYNLSDVYVTASSGEGFGLPIVEAMACGLPIIGTKYSAIPEVSRGCGLMCKVEGYEIDGFGTNRALVNVEDLADKMKLIRENDTLREKLGKKGIERVKKYYSWDVTKKLWLDYVRRVEEDWYKRRLRERINRESKEGIVYVNSRKIKEVNRT